MNTNGSSATERSAARTNTPGDRRRDALGRLFTLTPLQARRWQNFKANRRGLWSLRIFVVLCLIALFASTIANNRPWLVSYQGQILSPILFDYAETRFNGDFETHTKYVYPSVQCLIRTGGDKDCLADHESTMARAKADPDMDLGWILWPPIPWSYDTFNREVAHHPSPPSAANWLGTDVNGFDVTAIVLYGFRVSVGFALIVTFFASVIGIVAGAAQGFYGGLLDLFFQRIVEIWQSLPVLFVMLIVTSILAPNFWLLCLVVALFTWTSLVGVVRAEFLRTRNFEYVQAARALGVSDWTIIFRHVLPNAMVATLTMVPFLLTSAISFLAILDFLGFGLSESYPSLGELALQGKSNITAPWLGITAFFTFAIMLTMLIFIFEAVRDAFDPRKSLGENAG